MYTGGEMNVMWRMESVSLQSCDIQGAIKKFPEMWYYSTVMVGHITMLT